jgi:multiple sugar transport system ATP-binding protein
LRQIRRCAWSPGEEISSGSISIDGKRVNDVPPKDRDIAMVFQNYALYRINDRLPEHGIRAHVAEISQGEIATRVRSRPNARYH